MAKLDVPISIHDLEEPIRLPSIPHERQLQIAIAEAIGFGPDEIKLNGKINRFSTTGRKDDDAGWYIYYPGDVSCWAFGDWRTGTYITGRADIGRELSPIETMQHARKMKEAKEAREREENTRRANAAQIASDLWAGSQLASDDHPYIKRKGINNPGWKLASDGRLISPMFIDGELTGLQYIDADGNKRFLTGSKTSGAWWAIGDMNTRRTFVCEGVATGASINEATGCGVFIAYSANNLTATALAARDIVGQGGDLIIVADNDKSGTGEREAGKAAEAAKAGLIMPPMIGDANDFAQDGGDLVSLLMPPVESHYRLMTADDLGALPPLGYRIKGVLPAEGLASIFGPSGSGKSFLALDMASCIGTGRSFFGYRTRPGAVVYVCLEGEGGLSKRVRAYRKKHGDDSLANVFFITQQFRLTHSADISALIDSINALRLADLTVVIDTLARAMPGVEENSAKDMGDIINAAAIIQRNLKALMLVVGHTGKEEAKGMRGSSAVRAALDAAISVERSEDNRSWTVDKSKDDIDGKSHPFNLSVVELGEDEDGDLITSCVISPGDDEYAVNIPKESRETKKARELLESLLDNHSYIHKLDGDLVIPRQVFADAVKKWPECESSKDQVSYVKNVVTRLISAGIVSRKDGNLSLKIECGIVKTVHNLCK